MAKYVIHQAIKEWDEYEVEADSEAEALAKHDDMDSEYIGTSKICDIEWLDERSVKS
jgi:hypothetical protein